MPFFAKDWFPYKQVLSDKIDSVHVFVTTDSDLMAASNGIHTGTTYFPNGKVRYEWKSNYPIVFYLISIAISDYAEYSIEANPVGASSPVLIQNFLYDVPGCLDEYRDKINVTIDIMELYSELFGPYPFQDEKYGHYLWPWGGGMEHQTMTGMGNFEFYLIAHELGHSWFGNYITCSTWQDIWINEGFATYAGYLATENLAPEYAAGEIEFSFERAMRELDGTVFVPEEDADNDGRIFSGNLSYRKGMSLLHMIRFELNDDQLFFRILKDYVSQYGNSVARGIDFQALLEDISGLDFSDFFTQWYFGEGFPIFDVSWQQVGQSFTLNSNQTTSSMNTPLFKTAMEYRLVYAGGDTIIRVQHLVNDEVYTLDINHTITDIEVDPNNWVLNDLIGVTKYLGVETHSLIQSIYPNPGDGMLKFKINTKGNLRLDIYNQLGQLMRRVEYDQIDPYSNYRLDLTDLKEGIYLVKTTSGDRVETERIIINK
jgi:aminopeptidase N